jgi:hypothetical protein
MAILSSLRLSRGRGRRRGTVGHGERGHVAHNAKVAADRRTRLDHQRAVKFVPGDGGDGAGPDFFARLLFDVDPVVGVGGDVARFARLGDDQDHRLIIDGERANRRRPALGVGGRNCMVSPLIDTIVPRAQRPRAFWLRSSGPQLVGCSSSGGGLASACGAAAWVVAGAGWVEASRRTGRVIGRRVGRVAGRGAAEAVARSAIDNTMIPSLAAWPIPCMTPPAFFEVRVKCTKTTKRPRAGE